MSGELRRWLVVAGSIAAVLAIPLITQDGYIIQLLNIAILNTIVVLGLNFVTGWAGQINFGQAAFYGLGAYTTAIATKSGLPWITTPFLSAIVVIVASLALGLPTMRLRTYYLAMTTIGFGEIIRSDHRALGAGHGRHVGPPSHSRHQHFRHRRPRDRFSITTFLPQRWRWP